LVTKSLTKNLSLKISRFSYNFLVVETDGRSYFMAVPSKTSYCVGTP